MTSGEPQPQHFSGTPQQPPPPGTNTTKIVFLVVGGVLLTMLLACGGFLAIGYWAARGAYQTAVDSFQEVYVDELKQKLGDDMAKVEAEVGEIQRISYDFQRSVEETTERVDVDVYEIAGTTGSGEVIVRERTTGETTATQIVTLYLDDGRELLIQEKEIELPEDETLVEEEAEEGAEGAQ